MDKDIENMVRQCSVCLEIRPHGSKTVHTWPQSSYPFQRIHMDWAYIKETRSQVLVIVDSFSGWIEAFPLKHRETASVIQCLRSVFTRFGVPELLVSDNAREFTSEELNKWLSINGVSKLESPLYFPRSNGSAERAVQTVKNALKSWKYNKVHTDFVSFLQKVLLHHRVSSASRSKSPAKIVFGRTLRLPIVSKFKQGEEIWYTPERKKSSKATFLMTKGTNTSWLLSDEDGLLLSSNNQISPMPDIVPESDEPTIVTDSNKSNEPSFQRTCGNRVK